MRILDNLNSCLLIGIPPFIDDASDFGSDYEQNNEGNVSNIDNSINFWIKTNHSPGERQKSAILAPCSYLSLYFNSMQKSRASSIIYWLCFFPLTNSYIVIAYSSLSVRKVKPWSYFLVSSFNFLTFIVKTYLPSNNLTSYKVRMCATIFWTSLYDRWKHEDISYSLNDNERRAQEYYVSNSAQNPTFLSWTDLFNNLLGIWEYSFRRAAVKSGRTSYINSECFMKWWYKR